MLFLKTLEDVKFAVDGILSSYSNAKIRVIDKVQR